MIQAAKIMSHIYKKSLVPRTQEAKTHRRDLEAKNDLESSSRDKEEHHAEAATPWSPINRSVRGASAHLLCARNATANSSLSVTAEWC